MKQKTKKILGIILQAPLVLVVVISFFVSIYAAYNNLFGITYGSAVISGIVIVLYVLGIWLMPKKNSPSN